MHSAVGRAAERGSLHKKQHACTSDDAKPQQGAAAPCTVVGSRRVAQSMLQPTSRRQMRASTPAEAAHRLLKQAVVPLHAVARLALLHQHQHASQRSDCSLAHVLLQTTGLQRRSDRCWHARRRAGRHPRRPAGRQAGRQRLALTAAGGCHLGVPQSSPDGVNELLDVHVKHCWLRLCQAAQHEHGGVAARLAGLGCT